MRGISDLFSGVGTASGYMLTSSMGVTKHGRLSLKDGTQSVHDRERMVELVAYTARSMQTARPVPFGSSIVETRTGKVLLKALNAVAPEFDPSSHAEVRAIRKATKKLKKISLSGYTLYTTCEPCPMCMSAALWAGVDRVVYGATIEDANKHCRQIQIHAEEVSRRSDMACAIAGPLLRDECYALFTHPAMLRAFKLWSTSKTARKKQARQPA
jgi:tRNA(adenine34) deaminase